MVAAAKGYAAKLVMPVCVSEERRRVLEAFGTEIELTPAQEGVDGAIRRAYQAAARGRAGSLLSGRDPRSEPQPPQVPWVCSQCCGPAAHQFGADR